ncbi:Glycosyl transferase [Macleaya cordata]|uniref:Glycosyl transferase n=1 Tax=Macleaya cordata TaxID=56857 RepID=A0A200QAN9_MACCD|nr:Glycosyl transferase [Macleaya cordata]
MRGSVKALARGYEYMMGVLIFAPVADMKLTYVATCQNYGNQKRSGERRATDILNLMVKFLVLPYSNPSLRVAYIDEVEEREGGRFSTFITRGGISKASRGINLSEDIFACCNSTLRRGNVTHHEYIKSERNEMLVSTKYHYYIETKVAFGNGEQILSQDILSIRAQF